MKLSLRKANALQSSINDVTKNIKLVSEILVNEFQDAPEAVEKARLLLLKELARHDSLIEVLYNIRNLVSIANSKAGIDTTLTKIAGLEKKIQLYSGLSSRSVQLDEAVLIGKLDKIRTSKDDSRLYRQDEVETSVLIDEDISQLKADIASLKKSKQALQDGILEANIRTEIELSETDVEVLKKEGLL